MCERRTWLLFYQPLRLSDRIDTARLGHTDDHEILVPAFSCRYILIVMKKRMGKLILACSVILLGIEGAAPAQQVELKYLSLSWAQKTKSIVDASAAGERKKRIADANVLNNRGRELYKKKIYAEASKAYEQAIGSYPTGAVYFNYANALYQIPSRYTDSIKAFEISVGLGYKNAHYAYYNIACLYSLMQKPSEAYQYLEQAVHSGFKDFGHIGRDPDLDFIRSRSDWDRRFARLQGSDDSEKYRKMIANKTISVGAGSEGYDYFFCGDGKTRISGTSPFTKYGTWKTKGSKVVIRWTQSDEAVGVGEPVVVAAGGPSYAKYEIVSKSIDEEEIIDLENLQESLKDKGFPQIIDSVIDCSPPQ